MRGPAPRVGQHSADVLAQLGVERARIEALAAAGVIGGVESA